MLGRWSLLSAIQLLLSVTGGSSSRHYVSKDTEGIDWGIGILCHNYTWKLKKRKVVQSLLSELNRWNSKSIMKIVGNLKHLETKWYTSKWLTAFKEHLYVANMYNMVFRHSEMANRAKQMSALVNVYASHVVPHTEDDNIHHLFTFS